MRPSCLRRALLLALLWASSAPAQPLLEPATSRELNEYDPSRVLQQAPMLGRLPLSLDDAIVLGLASNLDVELQRFRPLIAQEQKESAWGAYDPNWVSDFGYASNEIPVASALQRGAAINSWVTDGIGGFQGLIPFLNADYDISISGGRNTSTSSIQTLSPELTSAFSLRLNIPLLRDLIWNDSWTNLKLQAIQSDVEREEFRAVLMDTVAAIEGRYWDLIAQKGLTLVAAKTLETAQQTLEQTRTEYEVGVKSNVEVVEAQAAVAEREFDLIVAENDYQTAMDQLINVVFGPRLTPGTNLLIDPTDNPDADISYRIDVEEAVARAFANRPELRAEQERIEQNAIQLRFAKNQRLPRFNLQVGYGYQGLAGDPNDAAIDFQSGTTTLINSINTNLADPLQMQTPPLDPQVNSLPIPPPAPPPNVGDSFGDTFENYFSSRGARQFSVRGVISIPIPNTTARRQVAISELELRRQKTATRRLEQDIILNVRDAARNLLNAQRGIQAARRRVAAAAEQLRAERVRLQYGESTPFQVNLRERDFVQAESQEILSMRTYRNSITRLNRQQGTILETHNINVEEVSRLR